jgi:hypothetical protein
MILHIEEGSQDLPELTACDRVDSEAGDIIM